MKIGVSSYSFQQLISSGEETQLSIIKKAKDMGFDGIEFIDLSAPEGVSEAEYAKMLREESEKVGLPIIAYTISANLLSESGLDAEIERVCRKVDIAEILGAKCLRHDAAWSMPDDIKSHKGFNDILPVLVEGCRRITEYAAEKGITTMIENHGFFCQDSERVEKIVNGVSNPNFGVLFDIGNFCCADEDSTKAAGRLSPYIKHVHAKDFHIRSGNGLNPGKGFFKSRGGNYLRGSIIGHGDIPVYQCLSVIKNSGYEGWVSVEFEGLEKCLDGIEIGFENLKKMTEMI
ncbi:MAG: sugar phosphate isomerase/epimerase family protein [Acutalibacteraceae bacterium]|nr:sugar phosphate isomerase/epimerase family protein [Acutalibacteraceae bacterium]